MFIVNFDSFRNEAENLAVRGPMLTHIQASHTDALKTHSPQKFSASLLEYEKRTVNT